ncbi:hypothetical protein F0256_22715 [Vibrio europaeus]|nr:hypothetical protein [Vibrio europaeus]
MKFDNNKKLLIYLLSLNFSRLIIFPLGFLLIASIATLCLSSYNYIRKQVWDFYGAWDELHLSFFIWLPITYVFYLTFKDAYIDIRRYIKSSKNNKS